MMVYKKARAQSDTAIRRSSVRASTIDEASISGEEPSKILDQ